MGARAISYVRVSGNGQVRGDGFPRQRKAIADYARRYRVEVIEEFRDVHTGAKEMEGREGLAALLDRLESNGVDLVLVENASRLARSLMISEVILGQLRDRGVRVVAADSGTDLLDDDDDPTRTLIRQVLGAVAQFEKSVLVSKLRAARDRKRRRGERVEGRKPFGFHAAEQRTLERIRTLYRKRRNRPRRSFGEIASALNVGGLATRSGRPWTRQTVREIVRRQPWGSARA